MIILDLVEVPRTPLFYMNPKIHKPNTPGRPIISGCDSPTEKLSIYIDHFLKPLVPLIPSYIKDTTHFLNTLFAIPTTLPPNTILATLDVTSLYTNIPHAEGIASATEALYNKHTEITHRKKNDVINDVTNRYRAGSAIRFYRLPLKKPKLLKIWLQRIRCESIPINEYTRVCSDHFRFSGSPKNTTILHEPKNTQTQHTWKTNHFRL